MRLNYVTLFLNMFENAQDNVLQVWRACGWKTTCVDSTTFFSGMRGQLLHPLLVDRLTKEEQSRFKTIKQRWLDIQPLLEKEIDVGEQWTDGNRQSDGI